MTAEARRQTPPLPTSIASVYLIGICGTGMGSLAGMLHEQGLRVLGSDRGIYPPMSTFLESRGITILPGWDGANLERLAAAGSAPDLVVVGNVCRRDNPEVAAAAALGIASLSLPEVLRELFLRRVPQRVVVSGTHGKTTTSSMIAWLLEHAGRAPSFMIGGITGNFGRNFKVDSGAEFVVEGDEYDSAFFDKVPKFWHYEPTTLVINNIEYDHADIYGSLDEILFVFRRLAETMPCEGTIWANLDDANVRGVIASASCRVRGLQVVAAEADAQPEAHPQAEMVARAVELLPEGGARFEVWQGSARLGVLESPVPGLHNVYNALSAASVALGLGIPFDTVASGLSTFRSVRKRQELVGEADGVLVYDDFAHHPTAVRETVGAIARRHPGRRLWGVFEAKSNTSRRAVFQDDYVTALVGCDEVILSAPWRKDDDLPPEKLIDLARVASELRAQGTPARLVPEVDAVVALLAAEVQPGDVVLGMSGSAFGGLHRKLLDALEARATGGG